MSTANKSRAMHLNRIWISHTQTQVVHFFHPFLFVSLFYSTYSPSLACTWMCHRLHTKMECLSLSLSRSHSFYVIEAVLSRKNERNKWQNGNTTNVNNCCRWYWRESTLTHPEWVECMNVCMFTGNWILNGAHYYEACENWKILFISSSDFKL